ncbi:MAG: NAD-dependent epimerase/dehydratase family protein [Candidatus Azobacteroides sp.]|nr:NAD-dependent epimerase/dehydratase family protein [Candidatus Azobacteroides sp.]
MQPEYSRHRRKRVLITGAAGNLGSLSARYLKDKPLELNLLIHRKEVDPMLRFKENIRIFRADLAEAETLYPALEGVDVVVHFAGVLFKAHPEKFLPVTNIDYFNHLLDVAIKQNVKRIILISFPHTEGETTPQHPATGRLDQTPVSVHAQTRLEEEKILFRKGAETGIETVSLRVGMVYGKGILMIDTAQWFARHYLLGIWKKPTFIHLISKEDFAATVAAAVERPGIQGIYHVGDEGIQTLQEFLDVITTFKGNHNPWRLPVWMILSAARIFEWFSAVFGTASPLTCDFIRIGMVSYYGDTSRMRKDLLPELRYKTFRDGLETM